MVTSDFRPEVEIWPFRACAVKISTITLIIYYRNSSVIVKLLLWTCYWLGEWGKATRPPPSLVQEKNLWDQWNGGFSGRMSFLPPNHQCSSTEGTNPNQCPGVILSLSTTGLQMETALLLFRRLSDIPVAIPKGRYSDGPKGPKG